MSLNQWIVLLLSLMFVSAFGIAEAPGSAPLGSVFVFGFLAAVFGLVGTSLVPLALPALASRRESSVYSALGLPGTLSAGDFRDVSAAFWARLDAASAKIAPFRAGNASAPREDVDQGP